jgi:hypothetical protein
MEDIQAPVPNGNGERKYRTAIYALSVTLLTGIVLEGGLGIALLWHPPADWAVVNRLLEHWGQLNLMIAGGLLALSRPQGS